jgi:hypothetical protein
MFRREVAATNQAKFKSSIDVIHAQPDLAAFGDKLAGLSRGFVIT